MKRKVALFVVIGLMSSLVAHAQEKRAKPEKKELGKTEPIFSGPQAGEKLASFTVKGVFGDEADKEFDVIKQAGGKPVFLVFVHELTRPSVAVVRALTSYAEKRKKDGLQSAVVFLFDDVTAGQERLRRARRALPQKTLVGISVDGKEGPGAYGLNRKVTLTVLIAKENKVAANFALVQPSVQADVPKVLKSLVKVIGGKVPTLAELGVQNMDATLRRLVGPVIRENATPEDVDKAAAALEKAVAKRPRLKREVGIRARRIVNLDKFETYGTPRAREYLKKWAKEFTGGKKVGGRKSEDGKG